MITDSWTAARASVTEGQPPSPPEHRQITFTDPEHKQHVWAKSLCPQFSRTILPDHSLSERLIQSISQYHQERLNKGEENDLCITGSRVLQRIIGKRYNQSEKPDRELYPVEDIDVWLSSKNSLHALSTRLCLAFDKEYMIKGAPAYYFDSWLCLAPMRLFLKDAPKEEHPPATETTPTTNLSNCFDGKIDLSSPMDDMPFEEEDPKNPGKHRLTEAGKKRALFQSTIRQAQVFSMGEYEGAPTLAPALTDLEYLNLLELPLLHKVKPGGFENPYDAVARAKVLNNVLPLLLYLEATRKMALPNWQPDPFAQQLLTLCHTYIPDALNQLLELLKTHNPTNAETLRQALPPAPKTYSEALSGKGESQSELPLPITETDRKRREQPDDATTPSQDSEDLQDSSATEREADSDSEDIDTYSDTENARSTDDSGAEQNLKTLKQMGQALKSYLAPEKKSPRCPPQYQASILAMPPELVDDSLTTHGSQRRSQKRALRQLIRLHQLLQLVARPQRHPQQREDQHTYLLTNDLKTLCKGLELVRKINIHQCPSAAYIHAQLLIEINKQRSPGKPEQAIKRHIEIDKLLTHAAKAGVTGAALVLLNRTLFNPHHARCGEQSLEKSHAPNYPAIAAARLVIQCARQRDRYPILLSVHHPTLVIPSHREAMAQVSALLQQGLYNTHQATAWGELLLECSFSLEASAREPVLLLAAVLFDAAGQPEQVLRCYRKADGNNLCSHNPALAFDWHCLLNTPTLETYAQAAPEYRLCQSVKAFNTSDMLKAASDADPSGHCAFYIWLPLCVQMDDTTTLDNSELAQKLKQYLTPDRASFGDQQPTAGIVPYQSLPPLDLIETPGFEAEYKSSDVIRSLRVINDTKQMDPSLSGKVRQMLVEALDDSCINTGIRLTASALQDMNARIGKNEETFVITLPQTPHMIDKVSGDLQKAIAQASNPYAAWLYAKLHRAALLYSRNDYQGQENWKNHYLAPLYFAAVMGVEGAIEELFIDTLDGLADSLIMPTLKLLLNRPYMIAHHALRFNTDEGQSEVLDILRYRGQLVSADSIKILHHKKLEKILYTLQRQIPEQAMGLQNFRYSWIAMTLFGMLGKPVKTTFRAIFDKGDYNLSIPEELQVSLVLSLPELAKEHKKLATSHLENIFDPAGKQLLKAAEKNEPLPGQVLKPYLPFLLCQLPSSISGITAARKKGNERKHRTAADIPGVDQMSALLGHLLNANEAELTRHSLTQSQKQSQKLSAASKGGAASDGLTTHCWLRHICLQSGRAVFTLPQVSEHLEETASLLKLMDNLIRLQVVSGEYPQNDMFSRLLQQMEPSLDASNNKKILLKPLVWNDEKFHSQRKAGELNTILYHPYDVLIQALAMEVIPVSEDLDFKSACIALRFLDAATQGCQDAHRHLMRRTFTEENSSISLERLMMLLLIQYQRPRQHELRFEMPGVMEAGAEETQIINCLDRLCLSNTPDDPARLPLPQFIKTRLLPELDRLFQALKTPKCRAQVLLLRSYAALIGDCPMRFDQFSYLEHDQLSHSLLNQLDVHLDLSLRSVLKKQPDSLIWFEMQKLTCRASAQYKAKSLRALPYLTYMEKPTRPLFIKFRQWFQRDDSWTQLLVFMGHAELNDYIHNLRKKFCFYDPEEDLSWFIEFHNVLPELRHQMMVINALHYAQLHNTDLCAPIPGIDAELQTVQHCHDSLMMERLHFSAPQQTSAEENETSFCKPDPAAKPKKRKKKKKVTNPVDAPEKPSDDPDLQSAQSHIE
ncbi:hypothetical protein [Parendozoicomonas haliclonae]|uniref:Uncharacterized protein n=1 Tax=Parendozoicomonas haliclonae TaxID=1960125 RepID=A0A1X7AMC5_9GAMM|nr:hypothetical protein [Parendozoicomonas haliclonae]SMA49411.1 hypothetical protein EHSB41UT_03245 [Parendozoicomonas haliclonae]